MAVFEITLTPEQIVEWKLWEAEHKKRFPVSSFVRVGDIERHGGVDYRLMAITEKNGLEWEPCSVKLSN